MDVAAKLQWVKSLLSKLLARVMLPPTLFLDNLSVTYLSANPVFHSRFVRDLVQSFELCVVHVSTGDQLANVLTKPPSQSRLFSFCNKIGIIYGTSS